MQYTMPTWSSIIASGTTDIAALQTFFTPVFQFVFWPVLVIGVISLAVGLLLKLTHRT